MQTSLTLPAAPWPSLTETVCAAVANQRFGRAGAWRLRHVRIDLPLALCTSGPAPAQTLAALLQRQGVRCLITAARRPDVALHLAFDPCRLR